MTPIVFLHIPKTAGQTVHNEIARNLPREAVSPIRVHSQARGQNQYPDGYQFYSGHLDWPEARQFDDDPFMFTILRDPRERIASFYFYLLREAEKLTPEELELPQNTGKKRILSRSTDAYFLSGNTEWKRFIRDHYDNTYCRYFASGRLRGWTPTRHLSTDELATATVRGIERLNAIYHVDALAALEQDLAARFGIHANLVGNFHNAGAAPKQTARWPQLLASLEKDKSVRALEDFVTLDEALMDKLGLPLVA